MNDRDWEIRVQREAAELHQKIRGMVHMRNVFLIAPCDPEGVPDRRKIIAQLDEALLNAHCHMGRLGGL